MGPGWLFGIGTYECTEFPIIYDHSTNEFLNGKTIHGSYKNCDSADIEGHRLEVTDKNGRRWHAKGDVEGAHHYANVFDLDSPRYNPNISEPADNFYSVSVYDTNRDGRADEVSGETVSRNGSYAIAGRSAYTEGMLTYFDPLFNKADYNRYLYYRHERAADLVYVEDGESVKKGDPLFALKAKDGKLLKYRAEKDGKVKICATGKLCLGVE